MTLQEFSSAHELMQHYRELHERTRAWAPRPAPPPPPPAAPPPVPAVQTWAPLRMTPMGRIMRAVAEEFEIPLAMIRSRSRVATVVVPRHVMALLAKELTNMSGNQIGKMLGQCDHSTILYGIASVMHKIARDPALAEKVQRLRDKLLEKDEDQEVQPS
jgi:Bacterial dnaA protein helix-turn-helix